MTATNRNPDVDRWLDETAHPLDATLRRARDIILGADPRVTVFHRGAEIPGEHPRLEGDGKLVRTMRFTGVDELEAGRADLEAVVRTWCELKGGS